jgi:hypothetical protein
MPNKKWPLWILKSKSAFIQKDPTPADNHGYMSEKRFHQMVIWILQNNYLPWLKGIAKASASEDWLCGIDFRLRVVSKSEDSLSEFSILVNVKSSATGESQFKKNNPGTSVYVVVMDREMNPRRLITVLNTIYLAEVEKHNHPAPVK